MTASKNPAHKSIKGDALGIGTRGELTTRKGPASSVRRLTSPVVHVTGTISAEAATTADTRDIVLTLKDRLGNAIDYAAHVHLEVFAASTMLDWSTGGSTGLAQGASGKLLALVAKKVFRAISATDGTISLTYLDTGTAAAYLGVRLPNGEMVGIGTLTTA